MEHSIASIITKLDAVLGKIGLISQAAAEERMTHTTAVRR